MSITPDAKPSANPTIVLVVGMAIFVVTVAAYLYCEANKLNSGPLLYLAGPVIAALLIANRVDSLGAKTNKQLQHVAGQVETVRHQTNGQLTERLNEMHGNLQARMPAVVEDALDARVPGMVEDVVRRVLTERDTTATAAVTAGVSPAPSPIIDGELGGGS